MEKDELVFILEKIVKDIMAPNEEVIKASELLMKLNGWEVAQPQVMVHVDPNTPDNDGHLNDSEILEKETDPNSDEELN